MAESDIFDLVYEDSVPSVSKLIREADQPEVLIQCINSGAPINRHDNRGWNSIHYAAKCVRPKCLKVLLEHELSNVNWQTFQGQTPLEMAILELPESRGVVELLLDQEDIDISLGSVSTPLSLAAMQGDLPLVQRLVGMGADINAREPPNCDIMSWLYNSFKPDSAQVTEDIFKYLVDHGFEPLRPNPVERLVLAVSLTSGPNQGSDKVCHALSLLPRAERAALLKTPMDEVGQAETLFSYILGTMQWDVERLTFFLDSGADPDLGGTADFTEGTERLERHCVPIFRLLRNELLSPKARDESVLKLMSVAKYHHSSRLNQLGEAEENILMLQFHESLMCEYAFTDVPKTWEGFEKILRLDSPHTRPNVEHIKVKSNMNKYCSLLYKLIASRDEQRRPAVQILVEKGWSLRSSHPKVISPIFAAFFTPNRAGIQELAQYLAAQGATLTRSEMKAIIRSPCSTLLTQMVNLNVIDSCMLVDTAPKLKACLRRYPEHGRALAWTYLRALWIHAQIHPIATSTVQAFHDTIHEFMPEMPVRLTLLDRLYQLSMVPPTLFRASLSRIRQKLWCDGAFQAQSIPFLGQPPLLASKLQSPNIPPAAIETVAKLSLDELDITLESLEELRIMFDPDGGTAM